MSDGSVIIETSLDDKGIDKGIDKLKGGFSKISKIAGIGLAGVTAAAGAVTSGLVAGSTAAVKFGTEYQKASNQLQASTGATKEEMKTLEEAMKNTYANNYGESIEDVSNVISELRKQVGVKWNTDAFQEMTQDAIILRDTFDYDVNESVRAAKALMDQFGIEGSDAFDLIAQGAQKGLDYSGEMLDSISEYSVQFEKLGFSAEDMFNIFESGANAGAFNLDKIGDAIKEFSIRAIDGSNTTIDGFNRLGLNADEMAEKFANGGETAKNAFYEVIQRIAEMDNSVEQSIVGVDLFGTMWEDLGPDVITQLDTINTSFDTTKDTMQELSQIKYDDFESAIQGIGRTLQTNLLLPISEEALPILNQFANELQKAFSGEGIDTEAASSAIGNLISNISIKLTESAPQFMNMAIELIQNLLNGFIQNLPMFIDMGMKVISNLILGIGQMLPSLIPQAIDCIITIIYGLLDNIDMIIDAGIQLIMGLAEGIIQAIPKLIEAIPTIIEKLISGIIENLPKLIEAGIQLVLSLASGLIQAIPQLIMAIPQIIGAIVQGLWELPGKIWEILVSVVTSIYNWGQQMNQKALEAVSGFFTNVINFFAQLPGNIWNWLVQTITSIYNWGVQIQQQALQAVSGFFTNVINFFAQLPGNIWNWLVQTVTNIYNWGQEIQKKAIDAVSGFFNNVINWFKQLPGNIWNWLKQTVTNIINWGREMQNKAISAMKNVVTGIINTVKSLPGKMLEIGKNLIQGIWNGISNAVGWLWDKISGFCSGIVDKIKGFFGIHSPSTLLADEVGKYMAFGVGEGFDDNLSKVYKNMKSKLDFETQKLSTNLSATATSNKVLTANITMNTPDIYMDTTKVARVVTPAVSRTLRGAGAY